MGIDIWNGNLEYGILVLFFFVYCFAQLVSMIVLFELFVKSEEK